MSRSVRQAAPDPQAVMDDEDRELILAGVGAAIDERNALRADLKACLAEVRRLRKELRAMDDKVSLAVARVCRAVEARRSRRKEGGA